MVGAFCVVPLTLVLLYVYRRHFIRHDSTVQMKPSLRSLAHHCHTLPLRTHRIELWVQVRQHKPREAEGCDGGVGKGGTAPFPPLR